MPDNFTIISLLVLSYLLGSFYNVLIYRIPQGLSFILPSSKCTECNKKIKWFDNVPIFSYIFLKGKCRHCKKSFSFQYLLVEIISPILMITLLLYNETLYKGIVGYLFFSVLLIIFFIDLEHKIIPNTLTYSLALVGVILNFINLNFYNAIYTIFFGALIGGGPLFLLMYLYKKIRGVEGMGMGDIKLFIVLGIWLGWLNCLLIIFISAMIGSIVGIVGILIKKVESKQQLPFGPFIIISTLLVYLSNQKLLNILF